MSFCNVFTVFLLLIMCGVTYLLCSDIYSVYHFYVNIKREKMKKAQKVRVIENIVVLVLIYFLFIEYCLFVHSFFSHKFNNVQYSIENIEVLFGVEIESVFSEKGKEKKYHILLSDKSEEPALRISIYDSAVKILSDKIVGKESYGPNLKIVLSETDYNNLIGYGNNLFRTNISILRIETEEYISFKHYTSLYRICGLSDCSEFTEEEAKELSNSFLDNVNAEDCEKLPENDSVADIIIQCSH